MANKHDEDNRRAKGARQNERDEKVEQKRKSLNQMDEEKKIRDSRVKETARYLQEGYDAQQREKQDRLKNKPWLQQKTIQAFQAYKKYKEKGENESREQGREERESLLKQLKQSHSKTIESYDTREQRMKETAELQAKARDKNVSMDERVQALETLRSKYGVTARTYEAPTTPTQPKGFFASIGLGKTRALTKPGPDKGVPYGPRAGTNKYTYFRSGPKAGQIKGYHSNYKQFAEEVYGKPFKELTKDEKTELKNFEYRAGTGKNEGRIQRRPWKEMTGAEKREYATGKFQSALPRSLRMMSRGIGRSSSSKKTKAYWNRMGKNLEAKQKMSGFERKRQEFYNLRLRESYADNSPPLNPALTASRDTNRSLEDYNRQISKSRREYLENLENAKQRAWLISEQRRLRQENMKESSQIANESQTNMFSPSNPFMVDSEGRKIGIDIMQSTFKDNPSNIMLKTDRSIDLLGYSRTHQNILSPMQNNILDTPSLTFFGEKKQNQQR